MSKSSEISVANLIKDVDTWYANLPITDPQIVEKANVAGRAWDKIGVTRDRIIAVRGWKPALPLIEKNFDSLLRELGIFYCPKKVREVGPAFVFPLRDYKGTINYAQTKPLEGSPLSGDGKFKYHYIGEEPKGPRWFGNTPEMLQKVVNSSLLIVVEGPFDLLAARLVAPIAPIMSPLTKTLGKEHIAFIRMLGIKKLILLYDNEKPDLAKGKKLGAGNAAAKIQVKEVQEACEGRVSVESMTCPASDPSKALENFEDAEQLKLLLRKFNVVPTTVDDDE